MENGREAKYHTLADRANVESYVNTLDVDRIHDPFNAGNFLRRFKAYWIFGLREVINEAQCKVRRWQDALFCKEAIMLIVCLSISMILAFHSQKWCTARRDVNFSFEIQPRLLDI